MSIIRKIADKLPISDKFREDVIWNMASFAILSLSGIFLNILVVDYYDAATLGVFNQVYSIYILFSQLAVAGINLSVLKHVAQYRNNELLVGQIISSAILLTVITASVILGVLWGSRATWATVLGSTAVYEGLTGIVPALLFFPINKIILAYFNARRQMKFYATIQVLRALALIVFLLALIIQGVHGNLLSWIFTLAEVLVFLVLMVCLFTVGRLRFKPKFLWVKNHFQYGSKAAAGNLLIDVNTRVDVLILGIFLSDSLVGIYSFAAMLAEGVNQLPVVVRSNVNPLITKHHYEKGLKSLENFVRKGKLLFYKLMIPVILVAMVTYPFLVWLFGLGESMKQGWGVFGVLLLGVSGSAGYLPFKMLFSQTGHPGTQTLYYFLIFITNVILNFTLIPLMGLYGAAIATAMAFISQMFYFNYLARKIVGINV